MGPYSLMCLGCVWCIVLDRIKKYSIKLEKKRVDNDLIMEPSSKMILPNDLGKIKMKLTNSS